MSIQGRPQFQPPRIQESLEVQNTVLQIQFKHYSLPKKMDRKVYW